MNQSIIFPDDQQWHSKEGYITFPAQSAGLLITCVISPEMLAKLSGQAISADGLNDTGKQALQLFAAYRFEVEELAEQLIDDECFDNQGRVIIR
jgi:hypothetical protein